MTYQQVIKQTEKLTTEQKQQLAYFLLFSTMTDEQRKEYENLLHYKNDSEEKINKRIWKSKAKIKLNDDFEPSNIRENIYDDEFYKHTISK